MSDVAFGLVAVVYVWHTDRPTSAPQFEETTRVVVHQRAPFYDWANEAESQPSEPFGRAS